MPGVNDVTDLSDAATFSWHPTYRGRTVGDVRNELLRDLEHDQRVYNLAMDGAEEHEHDVLAAVMPLDKRWGPFSLDWMTAEPAALVASIVAFEKARDDRRELFSYDAFRSTFAEPVDSSPPSRPWWRRLLGG
jgi:hypothetical protein